MSSIPFRTAFWALGLAFMMTVMLLVPNPQKIRLALHARRHPAPFPYQETLVTSLDAPLEESVVEETATPLEVPEPVMETPPVRVASADPTASIGYHPADREIESRPQPSAVAPEIVPDQTAVAPLNIPVPDPNHRPLPDQFQAVSEVPKPIPQQLAMLKEDGLSAPPFPGGSSSAGHTPVETTSQQQELSDDATISITSGTQSKRWNFRFTATPLESALKVLGRYQGYSVVLDEELQGSYSGQFQDADPAQAFAVIVKSYDCKVSRRGNVLMLSKRHPGSYR